MAASCCDICKYLCKHFAEYLKQSDQSSVTMAALSHVKNRKEAKSRENIEQVDTNYLVNISHDILMDNISLEE